MAASPFPSLSPPLSLSSCPLPLSLLLLPLPCRHCHRQRRCRRGLPPSAPLLLALPPALVELPSTVTLLHPALFTPFLQLTLPLPTAVFCFLAFASSALSLCRDVPQSPAAAALRLDASAALRATARASVQCPLCSVLLGGLAANLSAGLILLLVLVLLAALSSVAVPVAVPPAT